MAFRPDAESGELAARLHVDGADVTGDCRERVAPTHPPSRVELLYTPDGGWTPGEHEAAVVIPGAAPDAWTFTVG